ncbi:MAG: lipopolysaccharide transport system permease protein [Halioglobus sp.]|jgi:lipopolysaccharide transport system permease protein
MPPTQYFRLIDVQARMALKADASRYFLGYLWWILEPLLYVAVFYVVFNIVLESSRADFLVFLMCGKMPFIWFSKTVTQASNSIVANKHLIGKIDVPKILFPLGKVQEGLYRQIAVFSVLFLMISFYGYLPSLNWFWLLPIALANYLLIVACSFIGAFLVCFFRDISLLISLAMVFLLFTSGVFWDVRTLPNAEMAQLILAVNPIAFLLDAYRGVLMLDQAPDLSHLAALGAVSAAIALAMLTLIGRKSQLLSLKALNA